jgi:hypothetical protein
VIGVVFSIALSISANDTKETGRYQATAAAGKMQKVYVVVIDTQTGETVRKEKFSSGQF